MIVFAAAALIEFLSDAPDRFNETNPYLRAHPGRPLVTVAVPAAWALLLYLPPGVRRCTSAEARRRQPPECAF
jgi:hypothetical protein